MTQIRVYVVEDEAAILMELCDRLDGLGYLVVGRAASGEKAAAELATSAVDVVLTDMRLAGVLTGLDVARAAGAGPDAPAVVFLTAYSDRDLIQQASQIEPAAYLVKPFDERELHATLQLAHTKRVAVRERHSVEQRQRQLELRMAESQKEATLGRMAGATAHLFGNALATLMGQLELARESLRDPHECAQWIGAALAEVERAATLTTALRHYAAGASTNPARIELGPTCRAWAELLAALLPSQVALRIDIADAGPWALCDPVRLQEALVRLVANAGEAMSGQPGEVRVTAQTYLSHLGDGGPEACAPCHRIWPADWRPGDRLWVQVAVSDAGAGLSPAGADQLFEPFFSTRHLGRGLGLALVLAAVRAANGAVVVDSSPAGSRFALILPAAPADGAVPNHPRAA